ncbi:MAG TPA: glutamate 5-kinase [Alphaproteobacteria bacterium]|nr:glutamate 5-kinase [Alphaproteobacteria bacterium]HNS44354.1 glutamate 5-kinase [Alphaproteobacteria bacterium]
MAIQQEHLTQPDLLERITATRRFMAKIGSNKIACTKENKVNMDWVRGFIASLPALNREFAITSSGAIAIERVMGNRPAPQTIAEKQAYAAMGQPKLQRLYESEFRRQHHLETAQILVTKNNMNNENGRKELVATLAMLRELGAVPIINENDTVATAEIQFGDNDRLSAHAAIADNADTLILISDVDGFYTADPSKDFSALRIPFITKVTKEIILSATGPNGDHSKGGMETKLEAARIAASAGIDTFIISGDRPDCLTQFFNGNARSTYIHHKAFDGYRVDDRSLRAIVTETPLPA